MYNIDNPNNYMKCYTKNIEGYICRPQHGTVVINQNIHNEACRLLGDKRIFTLKELEKLPKLSSALYLLAKQGKVYVTSKERPFVFCDKLGNLKLLSMKEMRLYQLKIDDGYVDLWSNVDYYEDYLSRHRTAWYKVRAINNNKLYWALFIPKEQQFIAQTADGFVEVNTDYLEHGKGDFLVAKDNDGPDLSTRQLINGLQFAIMFNNKGFKNYLDSNIEDKILNRKDIEKLYILASNSETIASVHLVFLNKQWALKVITTLTWLRLQEYLIEKIKKIAVIKTGQLNLFKTEVNKKDYIHYSDIIKLENECDYGLSTEDLVDMKLLYKKSEGTIYCTDKSNGFYTLYNVDNGTSTKVSEDEMIFLVKLLNQKIINIKFTGTTFEITDDLKTTTKIEKEVLSQLDTAVDRVIETYLQSALTYKNATSEWFTRILSVDTHNNVKILQINKGKKTAELYIKYNYSIDNDNIIRLKYIIFGAKYNDKKIKLNNREIVDSCELGVLELDSETKQYRMSPSSTFSNLLDTATSDSINDTKKIDKIQLELNLNILLDKIEDICNNKGNKPKGEVLSKLFNKMISIDKFSEGDIIY